MRLRLRQLLFYYLPLACNVGLVAYLIWSAGHEPAVRRQQGFQTFALLYVVGGVVVTVSGITALIQASSRDQGDRRMLVLALVNAIVPTVLLLILLQVI